MLKILALVVCVVAVYGQNSTHLPVVLWHEMGKKRETGLVLIVFRTLSRSGAASLLHA